MLIDQLRNVPVPFPEVSTRSFHVPLIDSPFIRPRGSCGTYDPVNGAVPEEIGMDALSSKVVLVKFSGVSDVLTLSARMIRVPSGAIRVRVRSGSKVSSMFTVTVRLLTTWLAWAGLLITMLDVIDPAASSGAAGGHRSS